MNDKIHGKMMPLVKTLPELMEICIKMGTMTRPECYAYGEKEGITRHNVDAIRQMLGYSVKHEIHYLTKEQHDAMVREYQHGNISVHKLADKYGTTYNAALHILWNRNVDTTNPRKWTKIQEMRILDCIKKGYTTKQICMLMGKSRTSIQAKKKRMRRDGILPPLTRKTGKNQNEES